MQRMFPAVENERPDNEPYEHPMTAVGLVLMSAAFMGTSETTKLILFTGYSRAFVSAISSNMQNNQLWEDCQYDASPWLSPNGSIDAECLWTHIEVACGNEWMPQASLETSADPCAVYWDERGGFGMAGKELKTVSRFH
jgi:hypothetical protein